MTNQIRVDVICTLVCPWCAIALRRLQLAIEELQLFDYFKIECHPLRAFQGLIGKNKYVSDFLVSNYGYASLDLKRVQDRISTKGEAVGFDFDYFNKIKIVDTTKAHVLIEYAKERDKQFQFIIKLYQAYLSDQKNISDEDILLQSLESLGLCSQEGLDRLNNCESVKFLDETERYWQGRGVTSVPSIYFNNRSVLTGIMPKNVYKNVLMGIMEDKSYFELSS